MMTSGEHFCLYLHVVNSFLIYCLCNYEQGGHSTAGSSESLKDRMVTRICGVSALLKNSNHFSYECN